MNYTNIQNRTIALGLMVVLGMGQISCNATKTATQNANKTQKGAVIGGVAGAVLGGIIGDKVGNKNNTVLGGVIGGVAGTTIGGIIGRNMDKQAQKIEEEIPGVELKRIGEDEIDIVFDENSGVHFASNSDQLDSNSLNTLDHLVKVLQEFNQTDVFIEGHTDSVGNDTYNMSLSEKRAIKVTDFFKQQGVSPLRLKTMWSGETKPRATNDTKEGRAQNRRVEVHIKATEAMKKAAEREIQEANNITQQQSNTTM